MWQRRKQRQKPKAKQKRSRKTVWEKRRQTTTREDAEQRFLAYDQEKMIRKFQLGSDDAFLYLRFVGRDYRINRKNGKIEWNRNRSEKIGFVPVAADFEETLSILDVLCSSKEDCYLSGNYHTIDRMRSTRYAAAPGAGLYTSYEKSFEGTGSPGRDQRIPRRCSGKTAGF